MKNIIYIIQSLVLAIFLFSGCADQLNVESPDQQTSDNFWRSQTDAEAGLAAVYSKLECATDIWGFAEVKFPVEAYRDDLSIIGSDALNYPTWVDLYNFSYTSGNSQFTEYWTIHYQGISYANQVLEKVPAIVMDETYRDQIVAEARFLRAYYHMKLLLNWEKIVLRDEYIKDEKQIGKALSERAETWDFIVSDFAEATANLPVKQSNEYLGRATKGAAYAYLGYCNLTRAYEESDKKAEYLNKAETAFKEVKGYSLESGFLSMFDGTNKNSKESIFELQFTDNTANGASYRTAIHKWVATGEIGGWDEILPSKRLIDEFKKEGRTSSLGMYDAHFFVISDMFCFETPYPLVSDWFDSVIEVESVQQPEQSLSLLKSTASGKIQNKILISIPNLRKRKSEYSNQYPFLSYRKHIKYCTFQI